MGGGKCVVRSVDSIVCGVLVGGCVGNSLTVVCSVNIVVCICFSLVFKIGCCIVCLFVVVWRLVDIVVWLFVCMVLFVGYKFVLLFCISCSTCSRCSLLLFLFSCEIYFG